MKIDKEAVRVVFSHPAEGKYPGTADLIEGEGGVMSVRLDTDNLDEHGLVTLSQWDGYHGELTLKVELLVAIADHLKTLLPKTKKGKAK